MTARVPQRTLGLSREGRKVGALVLTDQALLVDSQLQPAAERFLALDRVPKIVDSLVAPLAKQLVKLCEVDALGAAAAVPLGEGAQLCELLGHAGSKAALAHHVGEQEDVERRRDLRAAVRPAKLLDRALRAPRKLKDDVHLPSSGRGQGRSRSHQVAAGRSGYRANAQ